MQDQPSTPNQKKRQLFSADGVKETITAIDPEYAQSKTPKQWEQMAERLDALARLLWEFSLDRARIDPAGDVTTAETGSDQLS